MDEKTLYCALTKKVKDPLGYGFYKRFFDESNELLSRRRDVAQGGQGDENLQDRLDGFGSG